MECGYAGVAVVLAMAASRCLSIHAPGRPSVGTVGGETEGIALVCCARRTEVEAILQRVGVRLSQPFLELNGSI